MFDKDQSGKIDAQEIAAILKGKEYSQKSLKDLECLCELAIKEVDQNGDGKIDYDEFVLMMTKTAGNC